MVAGLREEFVSEAGNQFDHALAAAESPIERLFLATMLTSGWGIADQSNWSDAYQIAAEISGNPHRRGRLNAFTSDDTYARLCMLQPIVVVGAKSYRVDFAFFVKECPARPRISLAVELDGHDFHERTKEQARRDKARDRALTGAGWHVLRFTGSEVYRDPGACLTSIDEIAESIAYPKRRAGGA